MTSTTILALAELPASIIIVGGGYIGCEFASMLAIMGVQVTLLQRGSFLLPRENNDVAAAVSTALEASGVSVSLGVEAVSVSRRNGTVSTELSDDATATAAEILVAVGRTPVSAELGLDAAGIELTDAGLVQVDEHLRATTEGVWAAGDVAGSPQFTHASWNDFRILKSNLAGGSWSTRGRLVP
ncbi:MAG: FAD-dependent oxidoreductase [Specibacter sp.]